jgi:hypothetical protein
MPGPAIKYLKKNPASHRAATVSNVTTLTDRANYIQRNHPDFYEEIRVRCSEERAEKERLERVRHPGEGASEVKNTYATGLRTGEKRGRATEWESWRVEHGHGKCVPLGTTTTQTTPTANVNTQTTTYDGLPRLLRNVGTSTDPPASTIDADTQTATYDEPPCLLRNAGTSTEPPSSTESTPSRHRYRPHHR